MSQNNPKTIALYGGYVQKEAEAGGAITPGMLVSRGLAGTVVAHGTAGGAAQAMFAVEFGMTGRGIDDDYAEGDQVLVRTFANGAGVYAHLAGGQDVTEGSFLASDGAGMLRAAAAGEAVVAQAAEDKTAGAGVPERIRVEVATTSVPSV